ncbi:YbaK/EbsC family protein [Streptomyces sp. NPDC052101]|uniref:aminoacyl-tRNA deacylase n=1 Tax=Streptomyces sp. NPDC052101 TaxID=3155763 RepID=UPI003412F837
MLDALAQLGHLHAFTVRLSARLPSESNQPPYDARRHALHRRVEHEAVEVVQEHVEYAKGDQLPSPRGNLGEVNASVPISPPEVLAALGVSFRLHEHPDVVVPVEVCAALGVPLERTVKTLAFVTPEDRLLLAALPGHARLRYGALARAAGLRRADLSPADAGRLARAGMQPGGVCPVSADRAAVVVFDETVSRLGHVHCGSGRADSSIEIEAVQLLAAVPAARTAQIAGLPADEPA